MTGIINSSNYCVFVCNNLDLVILLWLAMFIPVLVFVLLWVITYLLAVSLGISTIRSRSSFNAFEKYDIGWGLAAVKHGLSWKRGLWTLASKLSADLANYNFSDASVKREKGRVDWGQLNAELLVKLSRKYNKCLVRKFQLNTVYICWENSNKMSRLL